MKRIFLVFLVGICFYIPTVYADSYYANNNGVEFTKDQYNYISSLYYDGYQDEMTIEEYDKIVSLNLFNQPIEAIYQSDSITNKLLNGIKSGTVTENGRTTKIVKSCSTECLVVLTATWNIVPTVYSYDVIGFRISSGTINTIGKATVKGTGYSYTSNSSQAKSFSNGFGHSVKLSNVSNLKVSTSMYCSPGVTAYGSYQHAMSNITLANSKLYTIGAGGYGNVFIFYGNALNKYDDANGVSIFL